MKNIIYRPSLGSCIYVSTSLTLIYFFIGCYCYLPLCIFTLLVWYLSFIIIYRYTYVELFNDKLCIHVLKRIYEYSFINMDCRRYRYLRYWSDSSYLYFFYRHFVGKKSHGIIFYKNIYFFKHNVQKKSVILDFLSWEDYYDVFGRIKSLQRKQVTDGFSYSFPTNLCEHDYLVDASSVIKIINKCLKKNRIKLLFFVVIVVFLLYVLFCARQLIFISLLAFYCLIRGPFYSFVYSYFFLKKIGKNIVTSLYLCDYLVINGKRYEFCDITNIYSNWYVDCYGNEVKSLVITTNDSVHTYYLDYVVDNNDHFLYYEDLCNDLKRIFGSVFSKNEI